MDVLATILSPRLAPMQSKEYISQALLKVLVSDRQTFSLVITKKVLYDWSLVDF